ncbi:MAG: SDR family NAD(P)-dependent oxidoreductase [Bauldia sp.]|nr:SDR family NAD(P)-dependent oxidoreductase [Bauldia sp.]
MSVRRVVITGASSGIGRALVDTYCNLGWDVLPIVRDKNGDAELAAVRRTYVVADHTKLNELHDRVAWIGQEKLDVFFGVAGDFGRRAFRFSDFDVDAWLETLKINLLAPAVIARALLPGLRLGRPGRCIFVSTGNASIGKNTRGEMLGYRTSKSALNQLVRTMAIELENEELIVTAVDPGWVRTKMGGASAPTSPEWAAYRLYRFSEGLRKEHSGRFLSVEHHDIPY